VPRIEDFPVMPCEILKIHMKPVNFFDKNPALDVPPSEQGFNKSSLLSEGESEQHMQPSVTATVGADGTCCTPKL
jgi:primary-amine oxidase